MSFCFLHDLIIKEDSSVKCKQAPLSPRLHKPILDILSIYINIFWEKLPQTKSCSKFGFQITSSTQISIIFYKIKYDVQSCLILHKSEAAVYR